jgi:hypothetical protein
MFSSRQEEKDHLICWLPRCSLVGTMNEHGRLLQFSPTPRLDWIRPRMHRNRCTLSRTVLRCHLCNLSYIVLRFKGRPNSAEEPQEILPGLSLRRNATVHRSLSTWMLLRGRQRELEPTLQSLQRHLAKKTKISALTLIALTSS